MADQQKFDSSASTPQMAGISQIHVSRKVQKDKKRSDSLVPDKDRKGFKFKFSTNGRTDGLHFTVGKKAKTITFKLLISGDDNPKRILIGASGVHPPKTTFTFPAHPEKQ